MEKTRGVSVRHWKPDDIPQVIECSRAAYADYPPGYIYGQRLYEMQLRAFPEGQFVAVARGRVVGYATSLIVNLDDDDYWYTVDEITGAGTFSTHNVVGDTLYGADIAVHPDFRGRGIAGLLYEQRKKLLKRYNLRRMIAYGRIPGFNALAGRMTAEQYVQKVVAGEFKDSALNAHLKAGYRVKRVQLDITVDRSSMNYSTYLEMPNPGFNLTKKKISTAAVARRPARRIRVGAVQYPLRPVRSWEELEREVEAFVDTANTYHCHFVLFPEYFAYQVFSYLPASTMGQLVGELADLAGQYRDLFLRLAQQYGTYIIGGSHPVRRENQCYNVAHLFTPGGHAYTQDKLHVTPAEREAGGIAPGFGIRIFDTPLARIAIQVCYDIEFPEVSRLLALAGVEVIFVPFYTDEKKAYYRVRHCAQARAVENFAYVIIAGNTGNLRTPSGSFMSYSQAAVLTPSDFAFPERGVEGQADPNIEAVVISELALSSLAQQRQVATVRPLHDRRPDLYALESRSKIEIIRVE